MCGLLCSLAAAASFLLHSPQLEALPWAEEAVELARSVAAMRTPRSAPRAVAGFVVLWMLLHCGSELVAAVPPGQCGYLLIQSSSPLLLAPSPPLPSVQVADIVGTSCSNADGWYDYAAYTDVSRLPLKHPLLKN